MSRSAPHAVHPGRDRAHSTVVRPRDAHPRSLVASTLPALLAAHWPLYAMEAAELGAFMLSACVFDVLLFSAHSASATWPAVLRRALMGLAMGITSILIIRSPFGKRSGAQFNPAVTLTFFRLGKMTAQDTVFYVLFQFAGGVVGVGLAALLLGHQLAAPGVDYVITLPGRDGVPAAFAAEILMSGLMMTTVLFTGNSPRMARWTTWLVGALIALYVLIFGPVSGFSINPARTTGSAVFAARWHSVWIYYTGPLLGMLLAAELFRHFARTHAAASGTRHFLTHRHLQQRHNPPHPR